MINTPIVGFMHESIASIHGVFEELVECFVIVFTGQSRFLEKLFPFLACKRGKKRVLTLRVHVVVA